MDAATNPTPPPTAEATALGAPTDVQLRVPCYCEENSWRIARRHLHGDLRGNRDRPDPSRRSAAKWEYRVVFVSNESRCCPFFRQRATPEEKPREYVCWDYHVFVIRSRNKTGGGTKTNTIETEVLDVDTWLPYPCPLKDYLDGSFPHARNPDLDPKYLPFFRAVPAEDYLKYFYSDRMHMFKEGKWLATPPEYEPIMNGISFAQRDGTEGDNNNRASNLEMYIDMSNRENDHEWRGKVFSLDQFRATFTGKINR